MKELDHKTRGDMIAILTKAGAIHLEPSPSGYLFTLRGQPVGVSVFPSSPSGFGAVFVRIRGTGIVAQWTDPDPLKRLEQLLPLV